MRSRFSRSADAASELDIPLRLQKQQREAAKLAPQLHSRTRSLPDTTMMVLGPHRASPSDGHPSLPVVGEDDCVITPCASPQTPREVLWEQQYGSFLLHRGGKTPPMFPPLIQRNRSSGSSASTSSTILSPLTSSPPDTLCHAAAAAQTKTTSHSGKEKSVRAGKFFSGGFFPPRRSSSKKGGSRDALDDTLRNGMERRASHKKAFTEFHNSTGASEAPFLGDGDRSTHAGLHMLCAATTAAPKAANGATLPLSRSLERIAPAGLLPQHKQRRAVLRALTGVESWQSGRRYLILPAVLATCSDATLERIMLEKDTLGDCLVRVPPAGEWSKVRLVLRDNYLLEYDSTDTTIRPRGYLHLAAATVALHPDFHDTIQVEYKNNLDASPSQKSSMLLIRVSNKNDRSAWFDRLLQSRNCRIEDVFDYEPTAPALGHGTYAVVRSGRRRNSTKASALKIFTKAHFWKRVVQGHERADTIVREAAVQFTVSSTSNDGEHCPIVQIRDILETTDHVVLEMELLDDSTDLLQFLQSRTVLSEHDAAGIVRDIASGLHLLNATHGMAHRDVKPANILVRNCSATNAVRAKLCDFGMAAFGGADGRIRGRCGTPGYVAPEIFKTGPYGSYGNRVDVFSLGATAYVCLCGYEPFYGATDAELKEANKLARLDFPADEWSTISDEAKDFVRRLMEPDPNTRLTMDQVLEHPWLVRHTCGDNSASGG